MAIDPELTKLSAPDRIRTAVEAHPGKTVFSTSLGAEDQVILHMIADGNLPVRVFTLDTGRLFPETYDLLDLTVKKYGIPVEVWFPDFNDIRKMVQEKGINLFYASIENRKRCCAVRKTEPLGKALEGMEVWISGLRREQSVTRAGITVSEPDPEHGLVKLYPLFDWTSERVWDYIREHNIPYNPLHDKGFPTIGCQPCTRAVLPGEDLRAGRWWWENPDTRECGLHK